MTPKKLARAMKVLEAAVSTFPPGAAIRPDLDSAYTIVREALTSSRRYAVCYHERDACTVTTADGDVLEAPPVPPMYLGADGVMATARRSAVHFPSRQAAAYAAAQAKVPLDGLSIVRVVRLSGRRLRKAR